MNTEIYWREHEEKWSKPRSATPTCVLTDQRQRRRTLRRLTLPSTPKGHAIQPPQRLGRMKSESSADSRQLWIIHSVEEVLLVFQSPPPTELVLRSQKPQLPERRREQTEQTEQTHTGSSGAPRPLKQSFTSLSAETVHQCTLLNNITISLGPLCICQCFVTLTKTSLRSSKPRAGPCSWGWKECPELCCFRNVGQLYTYLAAWLLWPVDLEPSRPNQTCPTHYHYKPSGSITAYTIYMHICFISGMNHVYMWWLTWYNIQKNIWFRYCPQAISLLWCLESKVWRTPPCRFKINLKVSFQLDVMWLKIVELCGNGQNVH